MRRAARIDDNQKEVVKALRKAGCRVLSLAAMHNGCPDLLVYRAGQLYLLEVKDGDKFKSRQKLTPHQVQFHADWPVSVVNSVDSALVAVGLKNV
jgi:Holliday junction resolvase